MIAAARPGLALFAALLLLVACTSAEERFAEHMARGEAHLDAGRNYDATLEFQSALNIQPDNAELCEQIGDTLFSRSRFPEALEYYEKAHAIDSSQIIAAMMIARLVAFSQPERARELLAMGLETAPELTIVHRTHAHIAAIDGDTKTALVAAEKALELDPEEVANWVEMAQVYKARIKERQLKGRVPRDEAFELAIAAFDKVDELLDGFVRARLEKARVLAAWPGHRDEAHALYVDTLDLAQRRGIPVDIRFAARAMDEFAVRMGDHELRRTALQALVDTFDDDYEAWDTLARLKGRRAEDVYLELIDRRPKDARSHLVYAAFLQERKRHADAEAHLRRTIEDGLRAPSIYERLFSSYLRQGRIAEARAVYVQMTEVAPHSFATRMSAERFALLEGRTEDAAQGLRKLLAERESSEAHRLLAVAELRNGNLTSAREHVERAEELTTDLSFAVLRLRARIDVAMQEWQGALAIYRVLLGRGEKLDDKEHVLLARALHGTGKRETALEIFEDLFASGKHFPEAALAYAELEGENDPAGATARLEAAYQNAPADPELLETLTQRDLAAGHIEPAMARLDRVVAAGLATPRILLLRAQLRAGSGAWEEAEADVLRAFEANPMLPGAIDLLFAIYAAQDRLDEARLSFEQAEQAGVLHSGARLLLARLYMEAGDYERAGATLQRILEENPELWTAMNDLAWVLAESGEDLDRAMNLARQAHRASGDSAATLDTMGYIHLKAGRDTQALRHFRLAIRRTADRPEEAQPSFQYHLGLAFLALGREGDATRAFERALALGDFPEAEEARRQLEAARHPEAESRSSS